MGWFDNPAAFDWNGDGVIDSWDAGIELGVVNSIADDLARADRIDRMERAIRESGIRDVDNGVFERLCLENGLRMREFEQEDIDELNRRLN